MSMIDGVGEQFQHVQHILNENALPEIRHAVESYSNVMGILLAAAGGESKELAAIAADVGESIRSLGEVVTMLGSYPTLVNPYLSRLGIATLPEYDIPSAPPPPSSRSVNAAEYVDSRQSLPSLTELVEDTSLTTLINLESGSKLARQLGRNQITEQEALQELSAFLDDAIANLEDPKLKSEAESIRNSFNFIDTKKLDTACETIAQDWLTYLEQNPEAQILIPPGATERKTELERRTQPNAQISPKSDHIILNNVLERLDLDELRGRLVAHVDELTAAPENTRIIFLDDWVVSGEQMSETLTDFMEANPNSPYKDCIEINLVVARRSMLQNGFTPLVERAGEALYQFDTAIPVKAHYIATERFNPDPRPVDGVPVPFHVAGAHSRSDWGFVGPIWDIRDKLYDDQVEQTGSRALPLPDLPVLAGGPRPKPPSDDGYPYVNWFRRRRKKP